MASKPTDVRLVGLSLYLLPTTLRVPLKFGHETVTSVTCLRVRAEVVDRLGNCGIGWGETPLSVSWVWPGGLSVAVRSHRLEKFSTRIAEKLLAEPTTGHPVEIGHDFMRGPLANLAEEENADHSAAPMPYLASLVAFSAFDIAIHDAYGVAHGVDIYKTYTSEWMNRDLAAYLSADAHDFSGQYPTDFLVPSPPTELPVWHLVGGLDPLEPSDLTGTEPADGYPVMLTEWLAADGLTCLKIKLRGNDAAWDYARIVRVGNLALANGVQWLSADFNCTVDRPNYVNGILDSLLAAEPAIYARLLYVEQPFAYELEQDLLDVRSVSARKPLFLDESAHDWKFVQLGRSLGWSGVALKTCKTQTGALLSLCWAKAHQMPLMVQDLTNPMLAMIPHLRLAAHAGTIQGVECNAMQFYPAASLPEATIHPGAYTRRNGRIDLTTLHGPGFGYRETEIHRDLPPAYWQGSIV